MTNLIALTSEIACAYVSHNSTPQSDLPGLLKSIHKNLTELLNPSPVEAPKVEQAPAVPIKKSVTPDFIVCLEDGEKFKSLKRHLMAAYGLTPDEYRAKWGLPADYPMVAPNYAAARSELAKKMGLGRKQ
jgi:predicted transcriptional regulator